MSQRINELLDRAQREVNVHENDRGTAYALMALTLAVQEATERSVQPETRKKQTQMKLFKRTPGADYNSLETRVNRWMRDNHIYATDIKYIPEREKDVAGILVTYEIES